MAPTDDKELAFRSSLWRLFTNCIINEHKKFIFFKIDETIKIAHENGITDYQTWLKWAAEQAKAGDDNA